MCPSVFAFAFAPLLPVSLFHQPTSPPEKQASGKPALPAAFGGRVNAAEAEHGCVRRMFSCFPCCSAPLVPEDHTELSRDEVSFS